MRSVALSAPTYERASRAASARGISVEEFVVESIHRRLSREAEASDLLDQLEQVVDLAEFARDVGEVVSVPDNATPPESETPKNPKGRLGKGADYGQ